MDGALWVKTLAEAGPLWALVAFLVWHQTTQTTPRLEQAIKAAATAAGEQYKPLIDLLREQVAQQAGTLASIGQALQRQTDVQATQTQQIVALTAGVDALRQTVETLARAVGPGGSAGGR